MIPDISTLTVFMMATLALLIIPGPAVLYIVARSIDQGLKAGIVSILGISVGTLFHVAGAALGVSAVLVSSALVFSMLKYGGVAYLIYLGIRKLLERNGQTQPTVPANGNLSRVFYQGVLVNLLNPKTALFFFAFLPQFVDISAGSATIQMLFLGAVFVVTGIISDGIYAFLAGKVSVWLKNNPRLIQAQQYVSGSIYVLPGIATALSGSGKK
jgi:threonine/homoserine/homoserine lactone efflux protein